MNNHKIIMPGGGTSPEVDGTTINLNNEDQLQAIGLQTTEQLLTADQILTAITITYQED